MTGKDLIIFILQNNLEDVEFFTDGKIPGLMTVYEAAVKYGVGLATIWTWIERESVKSVKLGHDVYIYESSKDPRRKDT